MRIRDLEHALQQVKTFESPKAEFEQYPTSPHLATQVIHTIDSSFDDITDKYVLDLGCGTGMLAIAAALMGAACVVGVDIDEEAIAIATENVENMELSDRVEFCTLDVNRIDHFVAHNRRFMFDTVIMNPPFGTKRKGVDISFLQAAVQMSNASVYSMHKSSTRNYILKKASSWNVKAEALALLRFNIPRMYQFHSLETRDVEVDLWRVDASSICRNMIFQPPEISDNIPIECELSAKVRGKKNLKTRNYRTCGAAKGKRYK